MTNKTAFSIVLLALCSSFLSAQCRLQLTQTSLMHEMRVTPQPLDQSVIASNPLALMWPLLENPDIAGGGLDGVSNANGVPENHTATAVSYQIRLSKDADFQTGVTTATVPYAFYTIGHPLEAGTWYWQYAYVLGNRTQWSEVLSFRVAENTPVFCPPAYTDFIKKLPAHHPRVLLDKNEWEQVMARSQGKTETKWYVDKANKCLKTPLRSLAEEIDTTGLYRLDNDVKRKSRLTREARKIVDSEESNVNALIRAYLLTKDRRYADSAMARITEMMTWEKDDNFVGDFNESTLISLTSMAYDSFYELLTDTQKQLLLNNIQHIGNKMYAHFVNRLECHIADNHVWQMTLRILTFASFATYGDLPDAAVWTDYCYNLWLARFPGLNRDGAWHNGDSYFQVNARTLIEVPYFYTRVSGFNFFDDPWYRGNVLYAIYNQPPFSKSAGNGSSHRKVLWPNSVRTGYLDALARITGNTYAADYVRQVLAAEPDALRKSFGGKSGDLSWFRLQSGLALPAVGQNGLATLPLAQVFPQSGLANFMSDWSDLTHNAMFMFRSSPYGSTSHALANQNAFNTFWNGRPLFYSSGHHISFTDEHSVYCHRSTRAHNTILVNGMGQRIGVEGYGWTGREYVGKTIAYVMGDASNAYGTETSPLWLERGRLAGIKYTPENGWDENRLKTFRRHIVQLGGADLMFIYDELEADRPVSYQYLLHSEQPIKVQNKKQPCHISTTNGNGTSDAYLFGSAMCSTEVSTPFFFPAEDFMHKTNGAGYPNHWHFTATTPQQACFRFATLISTHDAEFGGTVPKQKKNGKIVVGDWTITAEMDGNKPARFLITNQRTKTTLELNDKTIINENGVCTTLCDVVPELEQ